MLTELFPWLGLSVGDDAVERRNAAALVALCGALVAVSIIYAGASIGEWPTYWPNLFCAVLGTAGFLALWIVVDLGANVSLSIAEERDLASGLRMCGFLLAISLLLGRAVAGNWHSEAETIRDFVHYGWPAAFLCAIALFIERLARPGPGRPFPPWKSHGLRPALLYLTLAGAWLWHLSAWEGMPG